LGADGANSKVAKHIGLRMEGRMGVVRMVRPWNEWTAIWGLDINQEPPALNNHSAADLPCSATARFALGVRT
jgi:hypothetical protein